MLAISALSKGGHILQDTSWVYAKTNPEVSVLFGEYYAGVTHVYIGEYLRMVISYSDCAEDFDFCATCSRISKSTTLLLSLALICNTISILYCIMSYCYDYLENKIAIFTGSSVLFSFGTLMVFYRCYDAFVNESGFSTVKYGVSLRALFASIFLMLVTTLLAVGLWMKVRNTSKSTRHRIYVTIN